MGKSRDIADSAATINYIDNLTSDIQSQLDTLDPLPSQTGQSGKYLTTDGSVASWGTVTTDPTLGTLTKTFTTGESATINVSSSVLVPVVSVTKEVPQTGITNNSWDVNSTGENYTRVDSAYATTLAFDTFNLGNTSFVDSFSVAAQDTSPEDITFSTDGTKMFVVGNVNNSVYEYHLSTAWDVSTASYVQVFSVDAQETDPAGIAFNTNGTKMFVIGATGDDVNEYSLSTAWDISTAIYVQVFSVFAEDNAPRALTFSTDGTKMFVLGDGNDSVYEYVLSTGFDVGTASYSKSFSVTSYETTPMGIAFSVDGTKMFVIGNTGDDVNEYSLSTAWDISTASYFRAFSVADQDGNPRGLAFSTDGTKMFVIGDSNNSVYEYSTLPQLILGAGSFASTDIGKSIEANSGVFVLESADGRCSEIIKPSSYNQVASGEWGMYAIAYNYVDDDLELSTAFNGFDIGIASYIQNFSISSQDTNPKAVAFSIDGTKMFVVGTANDTVYQYSLTTGFDVSTASYASKSFSVATQEADPEGIAFSPDGTKMFIVGSGGDDVNQYNLSTAWDVSTASYVDTAGVSQDSAPRGFAFNYDGTKMFVIGDNSDTVYQYSLTTGFDISTKSYSSISFSVAAEESAPTDIAFNTNGTKMFILGDTGNDVNEYSLSTAWDVSTASYVRNFSVSAQEANPTGMAFSTDGAKMFVIGGAGDDVNEYSTGSAGIPTGYNAARTNVSIDTTYWTDINFMTADQNAGDGSIYYALSTNNGATWSVVDKIGGTRSIVRNNGGTWQYNSNGTYTSETWTNGSTNTELATLQESMDVVNDPYDLTIATYNNASYSVASYETSASGMFLSPDGYNLYVIGSSGDDVNQFSLRIPNDLSTVTYIRSFSIATQENNPKSVCFSPDGTKMFVIGSSGDDVNEYSLSNAWDVSTASYIQVFSVASQDTNPYTVVFNNDGTKMFILGTSNDTVFQYALTTGFDVSTASYSSISFSVASQETTPYDLRFNSDGTKMYIVGADSDSVLEYSLSSAWDVSTASFSQSLYVGGVLTNPTSIVFGADGHKMYLLSSSNTIYEYDLAVYANRMDKAQLESVSDANQITLGNSLDLAIILNAPSVVFPGYTVLPSSDGVTINYDANILNEGAILGTDYDFDFPATDKVRITSLGNNNLKIRVV